MSLRYLKTVFEAIRAIDSISVQLLRIVNNKGESNYISRQIQINPEEELTGFIKSVSEKYASAKYWDSVGSVDDYQGEIVKGNIYKLSVDNALICGCYDKLDKSTANPDTEGEIMKKSWNALLIQGNVNINGEEEQIKLISMKSPVTVLKNRYGLSGKDQFTKVSKPVLTLNKNLDAVIIDGNVYMITMQAENLFNMERTYKMQCGKKVDEIVALNILSNADTFMEVAKKGQNPRKFVSFNQSRLDALRNYESRIKYMSMFDIALTDDGMIDTEDSKTPDRLVRFLCNKAMLDPIDEKPWEVYAAKVWS